MERAEVQTAHGDLFSLLLPFRHHFSGLLSVVLRLAGERICLIASIRKGSLRELKIQQDGVE
jgi:hypothetical protein